MTKLLIKLRSRVRKFQFKRKGILRLFEEELGPMNIYCVNAEAKDYKEPPKSILPLTREQQIINWELQIKRNVAAIEELRKENIKLQRCIGDTTVV